MMILGMIAILACVCLMVISSWRPVVWVSNILNAQIQIDKREVTLAADVSVGPSSRWLGLTCWGDFCVGACDLYHELPDHAFGLLIFPLWALLVLSGGCTLIGLRLWRRSARERTRGLCSTCGYNLTGNVSGICPECGTAISPATGSDPPARRVDR